MFEKEDILRMCTDLMNQASKWMFDQEGFRAWGHVGEEEDTKEEDASEDAITTGGRRGFAVVATIAIAKGVVVVVRSHSSPPFFGCLGFKNTPSKQIRGDKGAIMVGKRVSGGKYHVTEEEK